MYQLNLLSIILIVIALCIFYNEYNNKLTLPEICLFAIAFIAIVRASYNYIVIDNKLNKTNTYESFVSNEKGKKSLKGNKNNKHLNKNSTNNSSKKAIKNNTKDKFDVILNSEESEEYFDIENEQKNINKLKQDIHELKQNSIVDKTAVNKVDSLFGVGINNKELFGDNNVSPTTPPTATTTSPTTTKPTPTQNN